MTTVNLVGSCCSDMSLSLSLLLFVIGCYWLLLMSLLLLSLLSSLLFVMACYWLSLVVIWLLSVVAIVNAAACHCLLSVWNNNNTFYCHRCSYGCCYDNQQQPSQ